MPDHLRRLITYRWLLVAGGIVLVLVFGFIFWNTLGRDTSLPDRLADEGEAGSAILRDFGMNPVVAFAAIDRGYEVTDDRSSGIRITTTGSQSESPKPEDTFRVTLPREYSDPIEIALGGDRVVRIVDLDGSDRYRTRLFTLGAEGTRPDRDESESLPGRMIEDRGRSADTRFIEYASPDSRVSDFYAYEKDPASGERKLKHWTLFRYGLGSESRGYRLENARVRIVEDGDAEIFFDDGREDANRQAMTDVDPDLLKRAELALDADFSRSADAVPDFVIPRPFYRTADGREASGDWVWDEAVGILSVRIGEGADAYPIALDPTLSFVSPGTVTGGSYIVGEDASQLGNALVAGDFNSDGITDLAVGASGYSTNTGRVYVFYGEEASPYTNRYSAAVTETLTYTSTGEFNVPRGVTSVSVEAWGGGGAGGGSTANNTGGGGGAGGQYAIKQFTVTPGNQYTVTVAAQVSGTTGDGATGNDSWFSSNDSNGVVAKGGAGGIAGQNGGTGASGSATGGVGDTVYAGGNGASNAAGASGGGGGGAGSTGAGGNASGTTGGTGTTVGGGAGGVGRTVSSTGGNGSTYGGAGGGAYRTTANRNGGAGAAGHVKLTYTVPNQDYPSSKPDRFARNADVIVTGESASLFGKTLAEGDWNQDGHTDLAVGATGYSSSAGRVYVFYGGSLTTESATSADAIITGETASAFGTSIVSGDLDVDGWDDLVVGGTTLSTSIGRVYLFYDTGITTKSATGADVYITGASGVYFGETLLTGDLDADGDADLAVGSVEGGTGVGRAQLFYADGTNNFGTSTCSGTPAACLAANADVTILGESTDGLLFGSSLSIGDFNRDGENDLVVSDSGYDSALEYGRVYIFHNDGAYPSVATSADATITGTISFIALGTSLSVGDFNGDGWEDLVASHVDTSTGYSTHVFFNDGSLQTSADKADVIIHGDTGSNFGVSLAAADLNRDGTVDIIVGANDDASTDPGRVYVFYSQNGLVDTNRSISGGVGSDLFGTTLSSGDFDSDGLADLAVGATGYSTSTGRVFLFYDDAATATDASGADVIITGESGSGFGSAIVTGDWNRDGKTDLAVGADSYSSSAGRVYVFNGGSIATEAATGADAIITGESTSQFGIALTAGDFNVDGRTDLAVGGRQYSSYTGRVYVFNGGSIATEAATGADAIITGGSTDYRFGATLHAADFNADGKTDLVVGAVAFSTNTGRVYIFHGGSVITEADSGADTLIVGEATQGYFGSAIAAGDINRDGRTDLVVGAYGIQTDYGRVYVFWNDGSYQSSAATADVELVGESGSNFGSSLVAKDFNADGITDILVGGYLYSSSTGRAYLFHNDGSMPTTAVAADATITGDATGDLLGDAFAVGDFDGDGRTDFFVGAPGTSSSAGKIRFYRSRENFSWTIFPVVGLRVSPDGTGSEMTMTGTEVNNYFGGAFASGDFNADGRVDLAVGAYGTTSVYGRVYLFWNDGSLTMGAASADAIIIGEATADKFGYALEAGDFDTDGKTDLVVGAYSSAATAGRAYIFYNDGAYPRRAADADEMITGTATHQNVGSAFAAGDFNSDGRMDLAISGASMTSTGSSSYVFLVYNDGAYPSLISGADHTITSEGNGDLLGSAMIVGDFDADGDTDLAAGAYNYPTATGVGRVYVFYNDGSYPATAGTADHIISGPAVNNSFGSALAAGDFNADGETDIASRTGGYNSNVLLFYNDGSYPSTTATADLTITGESANYFGSSMAAGDFDADGRTDLVVGGDANDTSYGRSYIFHNDGSYPTTAATADRRIIAAASGTGYGAAVAAGDFDADGKTDVVVGEPVFDSNRGRVHIYTLDDRVVSGEGTNQYFGFALEPGDFDDDGKTDLAVGAYGYGSSAGRTYLFFDVTRIPDGAASADAVIDGAAASSFGIGVVAGDWNRDGKTDLAVGASDFDVGSGTNEGRAYLFWNDGSYPTSVTGADIIITGAAGSNFGRAIADGDFNDDGRTDLAVGASGAPNNTYIFYGGFIVTEAATDADITITGESGSAFGTNVLGADFDHDGQDDLAVSAHTYGTTTGRVYVFNGGSIVTEAATGADAVITGESASQFGYALTAGDFNVDGRTDLAVGANLYSSSTGRVYVFNGGSIVTEAATGADAVITGESSSQFGSALAAGDVNADGREDLVTSGIAYSTSTGRVYAFYNDGSYQSTAGSADVIVTGKTVNTSFGRAIAAGDWNRDGIVDLAIGADLDDTAATDAGRVSLVISEAEAALLIEAVRARGTIKGRGTVRVR